METTTINTSRELGARVARARGAAGLTQVELARRVGLDRSAISRIENGDRRLDVLELMAIADSVGLPAEWLVQMPPQVASCRGRSDEEPGIRVEALVLVLERDVGLLLELGTLRHPTTAMRLDPPRSLDEAELAAGQVRQRMDWGRDPLVDLPRSCEDLGLHTIVEDHGPDLPEGLCRLIGVSGIAWLNGRLAAGRRRFTHAHELGHHLFQDAYAVDWPETGEAETEKLINAFAIHLLLPRAGLTERWRTLVADGGEAHSRAILIAAEFGASWTAALAQLQRFQLISPEQAQALRADPPRRGDYIELEVTPPSDIAVPLVSPRLSASIVAAYRRGKISTARALELLRGTLSEVDLPEPTEAPLAALAGELRALG